MAHPISKRTGVIFILIGVLGITASLLFLFQDETTTKQPDIANTNNSGQTNPDSTIIPNYNNTGENNNNQNSNSITIITWEQKIINILIPWFMFNDDFIQLSKQIEQNQSIKTNFQTIVDIKEYKQLVQQQLSGYSDIDLIMIPTTWLESFKNYNKAINIQEQFWLATFVHPIFAETLNSPYNFIPHSIDPPITIINKQANIIKKISREILFDYLNLQWNTKEYKIPILRWFDQNDIKLLQRWWETFPFYFDILYQTIFQLTSGNNTKELQNFISVSSNDLPQARSFLTFKQNHAKINKRVANCSVFPWVCLLAYQYGDIKLWYLSDIAIWYKYFPKTKFKPTDTTISNFPVSAHSYTVKWRWFIVHPETSKDYAIQKFIQAYVKTSTTQSLSLWEHTLSAYMSVYNLQKDQEIYSNIMPFEQYFNIDITSLDTQSQFIQQTNVVNFIKKELTPQAFLGTFKRNR